ncbi:MAG: ADP-ribosylglycohydrolase family protein, partial [Deltaproteobacteria bacterium]|nr:ADP-ribosylglycohydrolase family protein [Deltaproteobacteria bacterium]
MFAGWDTPLNLLKAEIDQLEYEGYTVPESIREQIEQLHPAQDAFNEQKILDVSAELSKLTRDPGFKYVQPDELNEIRRERPEGPRQLPLNLSDDELLDRFHGAWTGRACGCALGKPVEILGMIGYGNMNGRSAIKTYLQNRGQWPLDFYFSGQEANDGIKLLFEKSLRENIAYMEPDDDIHYT